MIRTILGTLRGHKQDKRVKFVPLAEIKKIVEDAGGHFDSSLDGGYLYPLDDKFPAYIRVCPVGDKKGVLMVSKEAWVKVLKSKDNCALLLREYKEWQGGDDKHPCYVEALSLRFATLLQEMVLGSVLLNGSYVDFADTVEINGLYVDFADFVLSEAEEISR